MSDFNKLIKAIKANKIELIKDLIDEGIDLQLKNDIGNTALHEASMDLDVNIKIVELLVEAGSFLEALNKYKCSPLHVAFSVCRLDIAEVLIKSGADLSIANNDGNLIIHYAAAYADLSLFKTVIER